MKLLYSILSAAAVILLCCSNAVASGYKVTLKGVMEESYVLYGWHWGEKYSIDTIKAHKGKAVFKGEKNLECGTYRISDLDGKRTVDFTVPVGNDNFRAEYKLQERKIWLKKGNRENSLYVEFQNLINWEWEEIGDKDKFMARLTDIQERIAAQVPGTLVDIILTNNLFAPQTAIELERKFPFGNTIISNTDFIRDKVHQYLGLLQQDRYETIKEVVYNMIGSGATRELQGKLAHTAYEFFYNTKVMGHEGIAVEIARDWFLSDKLEWPNEEGKFMLHTFVEFNRHSLLGMEAPELNLKDTSGNTISLHSMDSEYTILYFYTDECRSCKEETPKLVDFVNGYDQGALSVYAVYADGNPDKWEKYIESNLFIWHPFINWVNVYDPDYSSGFQILYNVIKTPQIFLLDKEMNIIGRGLSVDMLKEILESKNALGNQTRDLLDKSFASMVDDTGAIREVIDTILANDEGNIERNKDFIWDSYISLGRSNIYSLQEEAVWVAEKYILGKPELWRKRLLDKVKEEVRKFNMNRLGEKAAEITLERVDGSSIALSDVTTKYKVLYFYRPNCGMCSEVTPKMARLYRGFKEKLDIEFVAINLGGNYSEWIGYIQKNGAEWLDLRGTDGNSTPIYNEYWLQNIPAIYLLKDNIVVAKDINDIDLENILKYIIQ